MPEGVLLFTYTDIIKSKLLYRQVGRGKEK